MAAEVITLKSADGGEREASAEVTRYSDGARNARAAMFIAGGVLGGTACIIVPVLHLITTWALPLIGIVAGLRARRTCAIIRRVSGPCPACEEPVELLGGVVTDEPVSNECPRCREAIGLLLADTARRA